MAEHTPGPWEELIDSNGLVYIVGPDNEQERYSNDEIGHTDYVCYIGDMETTEGKDHANATLIAAAPELLAACQEALKHIQGQWREVGNHPAHHLADYVSELAEVIAKAKGE